MDKNILEELKKNIGSGIDIDFVSGGLIFGDGVEGIITKTIEPNFIECDFCIRGNKIQMININKIGSYGILNEDESEKLRNYYSVYKQQERYCENTNEKSMLGYIVFYFLIFIAFIFILG